MSRPIRGNTGALFQAVAQSASQLAGPVFDASTGTLRERIPHCINNPISGGIVLSQVRVQQLRGLLDVLTAEEV